MKLSSFIFSFTMTIAFCPLDIALMLDESVKSGSKNSQFSHRSTSSNSSNFSTRNASIRVKRTVSIVRPSKWEPIWNELFHKPKSLSSTRFFLYTRMNPSYGQELCINDLPSLQQSNYDPDKRTVFIINGWQDNRFLAKWVREGIRLLLTRDDQNVIYVSWRSLKELFVAAIIVRSYSQHLANFIKFLKIKYDINGDQIHCIGHSLGGFMCGFAGDLTYIGRVTVLDAGPRPYYQSRPEHERLNRFQAGFMDVIHSDFNPTFSLGLTIPYGDLDFFPNSGTIQPGCWRDKWFKPLQELNDEGPLVSLFDIPRYLLFCSHYRSHEWFFESISNEHCQFVGVFCPNYQMFLDGECGCEDMWTTGHGESTCALMGYDAEYAVLKQGLTKFSPQGRWMLKTSDFISETDRHCQFQYQLIVQLGEFIPHKYNTSIIVTIVADEHNQQKVLSHERLQSRHSPSLKPRLRLSKLVIRAHSLPLSKINSIYLSMETDSPSKDIFITIPWVKLAPIHVVNNSPIFFCHLNHYLRPDNNRVLKRCPSFKP